MHDDLLAKNSFTRRSVLAGTAATVGLSCSSCNALSADPVDTYPMTGTLRARAEAKGLLVGSTLDFPEFKDPATIAAIVRDSNMIVPENGFNWTRTQAKPGTPLNFSQVDPVVKVAQQNDLKLRMHNLVYDLTTPKWVNELVPHLTNAQAEQFLIDYIDKVFARWRGVFAHVEVVNEPGYQLGRPYRPFVFSQKLGMRYVDIAYHAARRGDPDALLFTNAAFLEYDVPISAKFRSDMLKWLEAMLKRGVPIQAVGIEGHLRSDYPFNFAVFERFLHELTDLGLKFMVTELDVNDRAYPANIANRDLQVAAYAKLFLDVCFSFPECLGVITWNGADRYSWLRSSIAKDRQRKDGLPLRPTPLDDNLKRKPLWGAIAAALDHAPARQL